MRFINLNEARIFAHQCQHQNEINSQDVIDGSALQNPTKEKFPLAQKMIAATNAHLQLRDPTDIKKVLVFGDSLSDSKGRMLNKTFGLLPSASQYHQGRFTNGFTWVDFLTSPLYMNVEVINKAEGGAVSASYSKLNPTFCFMSNLSKQIKGVKFKNNDLAIISLGSNDYMTFHKRDVDKVIRSQEKNINRMIKKGAKNIVVMGMPDPSVTPGVKKIKDKQFQKDISNIAKSHNFRLEFLVDRLNIENKDLNIYFYDINKDLIDILAEAEELGYENEISYHSGYIEFGRKSKLNIQHDFSFNDNSHPSQELHHVFATKIDDFIADKFSKSNL
ncbi:putative lipase/acylhydrolase [Yersinia aldovae]|uniref:Lipase/acylhydrolase n=1 Tax=Yersinia aldovae TaxID=29483 RepID=A0A0T9TJK7_YERAL|nr:SGNH/GDSL hydrolase family protein [Yersinia aldovae]CNK87038.1 putative lipase/acylhydrolase [Yersinia aldovae]CNL34159.1 putative lipase/acylhydrolase [Yersinia aldovae]